MRNSRLSPALFIVLGFGYWLSLWTAGFPGDWALKAAPVLLAAGVLLVRLPARLGVPMMIGFVAAAAGDIFLALDRHEYLMQGLLCFLVTQLAYSAAFVAQQVPIGDRLEYRLPVTVYGGVLLAMMLPGLGTFLLPVFVYVSALVAMAVLAAGVEQRPGRVYFGAVLFLVADSLIGVDRFMAPFVYSEILIVGLYTVAQFLIFTGMLGLQFTAREERPKT
ncbi:MAG TPA: lysoplasmalogenase [Wenzhouxiangellaceae bacterium]|nr:lysoplasmalogenase [Wenzhouxiangellaceae bacterium]